MTNISRCIWNNYLRPQLRRFGVDVRRYPPKSEPHWTEIAFDAQLGRRGVSEALHEGTAESFLSFCIQHASESYSQLLQDLFVRWQLQEKAEGFFVEFGAANGVELSNTKYLEECLAWRGILAEPAHCWRAQLLRNRSSIVDTRCVWSESGKTLAFNEVAAPELSTLQNFSAGDHHARKRECG